MMSATRPIGPVENSCSLRGARNDREGDSTPLAPKCFRVAQIPPRWSQRCERSEFVPVATFGLVHGAWHGAWCWEALIPELQARGHTAIAMKLPSDQRAAPFDDYAAAVVAPLPPNPDLVLVGHSLAGMVIPLVALRRPVQMLVFLCALIPDRQGDPTDSDGPQQHLEGTFDGLAHHEDGSHSWRSLEAARRILYQDCSMDMAASAFARLRRQQVALWENWQPMVRWPDVPVASVHCQDDRAVNPIWSKWIAPR